MSDTASTLGHLIDDTDTIPSMTNDGCTDTGTEGRVSPAPSLYSLTPSLRDQSFRHVHGRSLNAHSDVYSLPADEEEAQRLYRQHRLFYLLSRDDHYYGMTSLVQEVLAPTGERQRMVLDLGCGPGAWTIQCATDFPHAEVLGVDLAPTSAIPPPPNCRFEIDDLNLGLEHFFGPTFDIIHARLLNSGVKDYAGLVDQVSRCLRPGGLVIFAEFDFRIWAEDHRLLIPPNFYTPLPSQGNAQPNSGPAVGLGSSGRTSANASKVSTVLTRWAVPIWMATMSKCVRAKGGNIDAAALLKTWLREHPNFKDVQPSDLWAPLGRWKPTQPNLSVNTLFNVKDKIALVSGGGSGIGFMIASALVQNGAKVYIASRKEKQLQEAQKALNEKGPGRCEYIVADLGSKAGCDALCDAFKKRESKLHILVNNSGATWGAPWDNFPEREGWDRVMALNVKSLFYMTSGLSELLQKDATAIDPGRVVNISSVAGKDPIAVDTGLASKGQGLWSYNTSKAAANHLTTTMAVTLAPKFITVNAILPGVYPSKMTAFGFSKAADALAKSHPMVRPRATTPKMSDHTDDEYEFTEFTEDELRAIDSTAEAALGTVSDPQATRLDPVATQGDLPRSRKSSGFSTFDLTEEELQLIDRSVAHLLPDTGAGPSYVDVPSTQQTRSQPSHVEISLESPVPSTLVGSPAPTLGRTPSPSVPEMASLYSRFRATRNSLSVSDLVAPAWCEFQFDYGLRGKRHLSPSLRPEVLETRSGKKIQVQREVAVKNDRILKKGTAVHKKLEKEIHPNEVEITPQTREDRWGLKLLNMISNLRVLIDEGCCREMPVMGFVQDHFVIGVIDEILWVPDTSQATSSGSLSQEQYCDPSLNSDSGKWVNGTIYILDNKTRGVNSLPRSRDALQSRLQLMLYKRLLDALLVPANVKLAKENVTNRPRVSFSDVWAHHSVDPSACFSPSFLQESSVLISSNGLGPAAENAICLNDLEGVWRTIVDELIGAIGPGEQGSVVSSTLKLVYRRRGTPQKGSVHTSNGSQASSRAPSPETQRNEQRRRKKGRAVSEDVELQRAIHESLRHSIRSDGFALQDETSEVMGRQKKDESRGLIQETGDPVRAPGGWISPEDDLQRAIDESKTSYCQQMGREALSPSPPLLDVKGRRDNNQDVIGVVEFDHDDVLLDAYLSSVLDFWHDRRPPRGVDMEDTGRCRYCEFSEGCEWLEAKAEEIAQEMPKRK
ncbi:unnamed protein product [Rhizoctonia solani]|nr:unnamed protein product [Rhizoctonia solani]